MIPSTKILVAEDSVVMGDVIQFNLQRSGFDVTLARQGDEAARLLSLQHFDILVTDHEMPGLNGEELCKWARNELRLDSLKIIMCTAKGHEINRDNLQARLNIEKFLNKPFSIRDLTKLLETFDIKPSAPVQMT